ncbi:MAG TPA: shikimate dehydrogenase [Candidatus Didemnitutus sp.]|nr:shikimate dehydrogenase [Candidatus Didemnitutus sp.]
MPVAEHPVRTIADLRAWSQPGTALAVVGHPVAHSLSPRIHNAALAEVAREDPQYRTWRYHAFDIEPADLPEAVLLFHAKGFAGMNFTVPHKEAVLLLAEDADALTRSVGAANTLIRTPTGWRATNTDCGGLTDALQAELKISLTRSPVVLLGAGGAARAAALQCLRDQAASLWIGNRTTARSAALATALAPYAGKIPIHTFELIHPDHLPARSVVINATTLGLRPNDPSPLNLEVIPPPAAVFDMIYNPPMTALLRQATALRRPAANGLGMLVHQGARSLSQWLGRPVPVGVMNGAARAAYAIERL